ncbi:MAG: hypothetical protein P1U56_10845, partial [Saprospiraceae bacterium]|nr:hypothetical protein [Saprospiraceae bacterium]
KDTLIVVLPTYSKKEALLKLIANNNNGNSNKTNQRLLELYAERQIQLEAFIESFSEIYTFSPLLYIPDSLVSSFEAGVPGHYFVNSSLQIDSSLNYANQQPIKLVQQFDQEWQIKIGNDILPNPFPNYYLYRNGLYGFLGNETYTNMYTRVATVFQKRFEQFYKNPDRRLYL